MIFISLFEIFLGLTKNDVFKKCHDSCGVTGSRLKLQGHDSLMSSKNIWQCQNKHKYESCTSYKCDVTGKVKVMENHTDETLCAMDHMMGLCGHKQTFLCNILADKRNV